MLNVEWEMGDKTFVPSTKAHNKDFRLGSECTQRTSCAGLLYLLYFQCSSCLLTALLRLIDSMIWPISRYQSSQFTVSLAPIHGINRPNSRYHLAQFMVSIDPNHGINRANQPLDSAQSTAWFARIPSFIYHSRRSKKQHFWRDILRLKRQI